MLPRSPNYPTRVRYRLVPEHLADGGDQQQQQALHLHLRHCHCFQTIQATAAVVLLLLTIVVDAMMNKRMVVHRTDRNGVATSLGQTLLSPLLKFFSVMFLFPKSQNHWSSRKLQESGLGCNCVINELIFFLESKFAKNGFINLIIIYVGKTSKKKINRDICQCCTYPHTHTYIHSRTTHTHDHSLVFTLSSAEQTVIIARALIKERER